MRHLYCACIPITPHSKCRLSALQLFLIPPSVVFYLACFCLSAGFHVFVCVSVPACCILFALYVCLLIHMSCCLCLPACLIVLYLCGVYVCLVCSVKGAWSCWSSWSQCTVPCGGGHYQRTRTCTSPAPAHGGDICIGLHTEEALCNTHTCQGKPTIRTSNKAKLTHCLVGVIASCEP